MASTAKATSTKRRGTDELLHLHELCADLARNFTAPPVEVLWIPGDTALPAAVDLYEAVRNLVTDKLHADTGLSREFVTTYGVVEEWGMHDFARSSREAIPALRAHSADWMMVPNRFANNMNTWGVGNLCCTVDYKIPESVGEAAIGGFCTAAKAHGMHVEMWGNTALSTLTWIFNNEKADAHQGRIRFLPKQGSVMEAYESPVAISGQNRAEGRAPHAFIRNPAGHIESDHYTPVFACTNLRDAAVTAYWHASWRHLHELIGVDGLFLDSSGNLSSDKFHWTGFPQAQMAGATIDQTALHGKVRPASEPPRSIISMYLAHLGLIREMQGYGYRYTTEDCGLFGVNRSGPSVRVRGLHPWMWSESICYFEVPSSRSSASTPPTSSSAAWPGG